MENPLGFDFGDPGGIESLTANAGFDLSGFDLEHLPGSDGIETQVYRKPLLYRPQGCCYEHAEQFARDIELDGEHEVFAFVSGNFVFGDFVEALVALRKLSVRRMSLMTLSLNDENIDSIRNILEWMPVERLDVVLSDYWYSHERKPGGLVDYLFSELDIDGVDLHVAFAGVHCKTWCIETMHGNKLTIHGSANLRSSGNIEQVCITPDAGVFEFVDGFTQRVMHAYDVVNQDARKRKSVRRGKLWQAVATAAAVEVADVEADAVEAHASDANVNSAPGAKVAGMMSTARCRSNIEG